MNRTNSRKLARCSAALAILFLITATAVAQTQKPDGSTFQLGDQLLMIPPPAGFEDAASQFEQIKTYFATTEAPGNDMLAVHLPKSECDKLRAGETGAFRFYTKVSVRHAVREEDYSAARFANLIAEFRKNGSKFLDLNSPEMKSTLEHLDKSLTELNKHDTKIDFNQPVNLGEFDTRPNVYGVILLLNVSTDRSDSSASRHIVGGLSYLRVKQRLIYVYTYRNYESKADVETLRDFTKQWIGQILAAN